MRRGPGLLVVVALGLVALCPVAPASARARKPWPPIPQAGEFYAHFGEEHWDDPDGMRILPKVVRDSARYRPDFVAISGDKGEDNAEETLTTWRGLMKPFDRAGVPYFAGVGNHDRSPPGTEGIGSSVNGGDISNYLEVFAGRPYPFGDDTPYRAPGLRPRRRPESDPVGASTHYTVSDESTRWVFLDNSCFSFLNCDPFQSPGFGAESSYSYLSLQAMKADEREQLLFVVMHMPTQDPRPGHTEPTPNPHTMGEGSSPDNALFEQEAAASGVDGVFAAHVKGQWVYTASGVPYYTDGGAGGEVYANSLEETGVDSGYWHGYRLLALRAGELATDTVPVFKRGGIEISAPEQVETGEVVQLTAVGQQPTKDGTEVDLELRDPDPGASNAENLPTPARIWTTHRRHVLAPVAADSDDPRRNPRRQTVSGAFEARCPGWAVVTVKSGWEKARKRIHVVGGPAVARSAGC